MSSLLVVYCRSLVCVNRSSGLDASIGFEADRQENLGGVEQPINGPSPQNFANRTIIGVGRSCKPLYLTLSLTYIV